MRAATTLLSIASITLALTLVGGCVSPDEHQSLRFKLQAAEAERDTLLRQVTDERAMRTALQEQVTTRESDWNADRALVGSLRTQVERLTQERTQLDELLRSRTTAPIERPDVPASPLPSAIDEALQTWATKYAPRVWYARPRGAVSFANDELFASGSDEVRSEAQPALNDLAGILALAGADFEIIVVGHTDDAAITRTETLTRHPSNWHLSVHRAIAIEEKLVAAGLPANRLGVMGYGQYRPLGNDRAKNRRVEIFLVRRGQVQALDAVKGMGR